MAGKVKKLGKMKRKCPGWDTKEGVIKSATPEPKKRPDAAVTAPEAATQGWYRIWEHIRERPQIHASQRRTPCPWVS
jgi:hypothetical protein